MDGVKRVFLSLTLYKIYKVGQIISSESIFPPDFFNTFFYNQYIPKPMILSPNIHVNEWTLLTVIKIPRKIEG